MTSDLNTKPLRSIILGAGCFWGVEDVLSQQPGVVFTRVGFVGGDTPKPSYERVCTGTTGHAEAVLVMFDPTELQIEELLRFFWTHHFPNGPNVGQYRSIVVCIDENDAEAVYRVKAELEAETPEKGPITTEILTDKPFYKAEEEHQKYYEKQREMVREVRRQSGLPENSE